MFVTRKWPPAMGGMETYSVRLTEELARTHDVDVVFLPGKPDGSPPDAGQLIAFPFEVFRCWIAKRDKPHILHVGDMAMWPFGLLAGASTCVVLSAHGTDVSYHRRRGLKAGLYGLYMKLGSRLLRKAALIANSRATAKALRETGWVHAHVVPLATDLAAPYPAPEHDPNRILFAGRLIKLKGFSWFVTNVLPLLPPTMRLRVVGTVWDREEGEYLNHPQVDFIGKLAQPELAAEFARALCVVAPNVPVATGEYEGFGLVAPEVASSGGVLLASKCDGIIDAVIDAETGFLVEPADPYAWASKINEIRGWSIEARTEFTSKAKAAAHAFYSWSRVADDTRAVYSGSQK